MFGDEIRPERLNTCIARGGDQPRRRAAAAATRLRRLDSTRLSSPKRVDLMLLSIADVAARLAPSNFTSCLEQRSRATIPLDRSTINTQTSNLTLHASKTRKSRKRALLFRVSVRASCFVGSTSRASMCAQNNRDASQICALFMGSWATAHGPR